MDTEQNVKDTAKIENEASGVAVADGVSKMRKLKEKLLKH